MRIGRRHLQLLAGLALLLPGGCAVAYSPVALFGFSAEYDSLGARPLDPEILSGLLIWVCSIALGIAGLWLIARGAH